MPLNVNNELVQHEIIMNKINYLSFCTVFPKEKEISGYISFICKTKKDYVLLDVEYFKYLFKDYKGKVKEMIIRYTPDKDNQSIYLFDDVIWRKK